MVATLVMLTGASGAVRIIAPLPWTDLDDYPIALIALTTANTLEPHYRLYGDAIKLCTGTAQVRLDVIWTSRPLQYRFSVKVTPSLCLISILYPMIGLLPSPGNVQVILTKLPLV